MTAAEDFEVPCAGWATVFEGDRVVDVAATGCAAASGPSASLIAGADQAPQPLGWPVGVEAERLMRDGMDHDPLPAGCGGGERAGRLCIDRRLAVEQRGLVVEAREGQEGDRHLHRRADGGQAGVAIQRW